MQDGAWEFPVYAPLREDVGFLPVKIHQSVRADNHLQQTQMLQKSHATYMPVKE